MGSKVCHRDGWCGSADTDRGVVSPIRRFGFVSYRDTKKPAGSSTGGQAFSFVGDYFITLPAFRQLVQTLILLGLPLTRALTVFKFRLKRRLLTLCAWLTVLPKPGFLPHISHR